MISETSKKLVEELQKIRDDKNFILGVMSNAKEDAMRQKMIEFIEIAKSKGNTVTLDDMVAFSVIVSQE